MKRELSPSQANRLLNFAQKNLALVEKRTFKKSVRYIINTSTGLVAIVKTATNISTKPFFGMDLATVQQAYSQIKIKEHSEPKQLSLVL